MKKIKCNTTLKNGRKCKNNGKVDGLCDMHHKMHNKTPNDQVANGSNDVRNSKRNQDVSTSKRNDDEIKNSKPKTQKLVVEKTIPILDETNNDDTENSGLSTTNHLPDKTDMDDTLSGEDIDPTVQRLITINKSMPEQRTTKWYEIRWNCLTASDAAKALLLTKYEMNLYENDKIYIKTKNPKLGSCCYTGCNIKQLFQKKCTPQGPYKKIYSPAIVHGTKYEDVACTVYSYRENEKVIEFGLMPHPTIPFLAASPDGITHSGRMLEIKVPYSREIIGIPLIYYWMQMQMQMQCCDLKVCDFVECKILEYGSEEEYLEDVYIAENGDTIYNRTCDNKEKGCLIMVEDLLGDGTYDEYHSSPVDLESHEEMNNWISNKLIEIVSRYNGKNARHIVLGDGHFEVKIRWWYLSQYSKVVVERDDVWFEKRLPDFQRFWDKVELYRKNGLPESCKPKVKESNVNSENNIDTSKVLQQTQRSKSKPNFLIVLDEDNE